MLRRHRVERDPPRSAPTSRASSRRRPGRPASGNGDRIVQRRASACDRALDRASRAPAPGCRASTAKSGAGSRKRRRRHRRRCPPCRRSSVAASAVSSRRWRSANGFTTTPPPSVQRAVSSRSDEAIAAQRHDRRRAARAAPSPRSAGAAPARRRAARRVPSTSAVPRWTRTRPWLASRAARARPHLDTRVEARGRALDACDRRRRRRARPRPARRRPGSARRAGRGRRAPTAAPCTSSPRTRAVVAARQHAQRVPVGDRPRPSPCR